MDERFKRELERAEEDRHSRQGLGRLEIDRRGTIVSASAALAAAVDHEPGELEGKSAFELIDERDRDEVLSVVERAAAEMRPTRMRLRARGIGTELRWFETSVKPFETATGALHLSVAARDVTDRVEIEDLLAEQLEDERRIAELSRSCLAADAEGIERGIARALATAGKLARADRATLIELPDDVRFGDFARHAWEAEGLPARLVEYDQSRWRAEAYAWARRELFTRGVIHVPDITALPLEAAAELEALKAQHIRSYLAIPISMGDAVIAILDFHRVGESKAWSRRQIRRLRLIGDILSSVLRRRRAEQARSESERRFRTMADYARDIICETDDAGRILYCSPSVESVLGYSADDFLQIDAGDLVHPDDIERVEQARCELFAGSHHASLTFRAQHRDGEWRWLEVAGRSYVNAHRTRVAVLVVRDVSDRQRETAELQRRVLLEALLSNLSRDFLALGVDEIAPTIERTLASVATGGVADRCLFVSFLPQMRRDHFAFEWCGDGIEPIAPSLSRSSIARFHWSRTQLEAGKVVRVSSPAELPAEAEHELRALQHHSIRSLLLIPACSEGALVGVLVLQTEREERCWSDHQITFLRMVAELFCSALRLGRNVTALRQSEERYRALTGNSKDSICEMSEDGCCIFVSPSFATLLGRRRDEIEGRSLLSFVHDDDAERVKHGFESSLGGDAEGEIVYRASHIDGSWRHLEATVRAYQTASGQLRIVGVMRDVSERERSKAMLYKQLELEGRIADFSRFFLDLEIDEIEDGVRVQLADLADLAMAEHCWLYFFPGHHGGSLDAYEWWDHEAQSGPTFDLSLAGGVYPWTTRLFERGEAMHVPSLDQLPPEAERELLDLERRGVQSLLGIPLTFGGQCVGFLGFETMSRESSWSGETITLLRLAGEIFVSALRRRRAEIELRASQQQLLQAQKMEAIGGLAGGISHDFNNHLAVMLGNARFLRQQLGSDPECHDSAADIERSAEHCSQLTRSLLAFSRRSPVKVEALDVQSLVAEARELVGPLIPRSIDFVVETDADLAVVASDATQLQQVLVNLIVNACDAMPDGGRLHLTAMNRCVESDEALTVGLPKPGDYVELQVRDTGVGMTNETLERIFEPFFTTKELGKGTGLGLASVYGIVDQSQGGVVVESSPDRGTEFRILLPASQESVAERSAISSGVGSFGCETVLLAEDEPGVRRLVERILTASGYRVLAACDGQEALEIADGHPGRIDALISGIVMPRMGGIELVEQLVVTRPDLSVLFVSGDFGDAEGNPCASVPGASWLEKPFRETALLNELRASLDRSSRDED